MSRRFCAALGAVCVAAVLIGCRGAETPAPLPENPPPAAPENRSSSQAQPGGLLAIPQVQQSEKKPEFIPSPNNLKRVRHLVFSTTLFTLAHELGHMVVEESKTPMIGNRENSADRFATLLMVPDKKSPGSPPDTFDPVVDPDSPQIVWAAWFWHERWRQKQAMGELPNYASRHGLDISRSVEVMCLTYGTDPDRFERPFRSFIPERTRESCVQDAADNLATWQQVLAHRDDGPRWKYQGRVTYKPAPPELEAVRQFLVDSDAIGQFASKTLNQMWVPEAAAPNRCGVLENFEPCRMTIDLIAEPCIKPDGEPDVNAYWVTGGAHQMILCYGYVQMIEGFAREAIARTAIGQSEKMPRP